jgi:hypothetical protein
MLQATRFRRKISNRGRGSGDIRLLYQQMPPGVLFDIGQISLGPRAGPLCFIGRYMRLGDLGIFLAELRPRGSSSKLVKLNPPSRLSRDGKFGGSLGAMKSAGGYSCDKNCGTNGVTLGRCHALTFQGWCQD